MNSFTGVNHPMSFIWVCTPMLIIYGSLIWKLNIYLRLFRDDLQVLPIAGRRADNVDKSCRPSLTKRLCRSYRGARSGLASRVSLELLKLPNSFLPNNQRSEVWKIQRGGERIDIGRGGERTVENIKGGGEWKDIGRGGERTVENIKGSTWRTGLYTKA